MPPKAKSKHKTQDIHERWKNQHLLEMAMSSGKGIRTQVNNRRVSVLFPIAAQHWELPSRMASIIRFFLFLGVLSRFYLIWVCWKFGMARMDVANWAVTALFRSSNSFFSFSVRWPRSKNVSSRENEDGGGRTKQLWTLADSALFKRATATQALTTDVVCRWEMVQPSCCVAAVVE
jgi:hypothetical protein